MNLRLSYPVKAVDQGAYGSIANAISEFINYTQGVKMVEISDTKITFSKNLFSKTNIDLSSNNLVCRNGIIYRLSSDAPSIKDPQKASWIMSALRTLKPGLIAQLPF